ncbi:hypothetical protein HDF11_002953 [Tunturiibacter psychrotolerans]
MCFPCTASLLYAAKTKYYSTFGNGTITPVECTHEVSVVNPLLVDFTPPRIGRGSSPVTSQCGSGSS